LNSSYSGSYVNVTVAVIGSQVKHRWQHKPFGQTPVQGAMPKIQPDDASVKDLLKTSPYDRGVENPILKWAHATSTRLFGDKLRSQPRKTLKNLRHQFGHFYDVKKVRNM
jgi:hypothetical protein